MNLCMKDNFSLQTPAATDHLCFGKVISILCILTPTDHQLCTQDLLEGWLGAITWSNSKFGEKAQLGSMKSSSNFQSLCIILDKMTGEDLYNKITDACL